MTPHERAYQASYQARRRADLRAAGRCLRCKQPADGRSYCADCRARQPGAQYTPLDEIEQLPSWRMARALRWYGADGCPIGELLDAMGVVDVEERERYGHHVGSMRHRGLIAGQKGRAYRLTAKGLTWLERMARRADVARAA